MNRTVLLRACYWFGAIFDGVLVVPMLVPSVAGSMFGIEGFNPGADYRYAMMIGASLMLGWAILLLWADRKPVERRAVLLLTVCPVVVGLTAAGAYAVAAGVITAGHMVPTWVIQAVILTTFTCAYAAATEASAGGGMRRGTGGT